MHPNSKILLFLNQQFEKWLWGQKISSFFFKTKCKRKQQNQTLINTPHFVVEINYVKYIFESRLNKAYSIHRVHEIGFWFIDF